MGRWDEWPSPDSMFANLVDSPLSEGRSKSGVCLTLKSSQENGRVSSSFVPKNFLNRYFTGHGR